jgi:hypothetical protein
MMLRWVIALRTSTGVARNQSPGSRRSRNCFFSGFTVNAVESDVAGCGPEYVYVATDPAGSTIVDFADPISADPLTGAFSATFGGLSPNTTYYLDVGDYVCNDVFPSVTTLAGGAVGPGTAAVFHQPPGRYLLCDPAKGSMNLEDTQVAAELAAGGSFANWVDGKDKNGNYIGLTCDPTSSYGSVSDTGTKVGPGGKVTGASSPNTGRGPTTCTRGLSSRPRSARSQDRG